VATKDKKPTAATIGSNFYVLRVTETYMFPRHRLIISVYLVLSVTRCLNNIIFMYIIVDNDYRRTENNTRKKTFFEKKERQLVVEIVRVPMSLALSSWVKFYYTVNKRLRYKLQCPISFIYLFIFSHYLWLM